MLLPMKRYMTLVELKELLGFPGGHLRVPAWQRFHSVIGRVALAPLKTIGKVDDGVTDPWAALSAQHGFDFSRFEQRLPGGLVLVSTESLTV